MTELNLLQKIIVWGIPVLFAITIHEVAHGWVANKCGDSTAKMMGRLTLNPIKHIDLLGTIIVPALLVYLGGFIFGWAKPVPVQWQNLRNPRRDMALVAIAGPLTNFVMMIIWVLFLKLGLYLKAQDIGSGALLAIMGKIGIYINLVLMVLNLLPVPPLDGSRVLVSLLPKSFQPFFERIEPFGFIILLALLATGVLNLLMNPVIQSFGEFFTKL
jgi:Zn-dependent protease